MFFVLLVLEVLLFFGLEDAVETFVDGTVLGLLDELARFGVYVGLGF
jgi:hypothetical protein